MWAIKRMLHRPPSFERGQDGVEVDRCAPEDFVSQRIRKRVQDGGASTADRRLAHASRAHRRFRIRNIQRRPLHVHRHIENRWRLVLVESRRKHGAVVRVEHPLLADRMAHPEDRAAEHLAAERARMNHRANVGVCEEIHDVIFAGLDVDLDFGKARDIGKRLAVAGIVIFGGRHQTLARHRRDRRLGQFVQVRRRFVAVVDAAQLQSRVAPPAPKSCPRHRPCGRRARCRPRSPRAGRRDFWLRSPAASSSRPSRLRTRLASSRASSGCRRTRR